MLRAQDRCSSENEGSEVSCLIQERQAHLYPAGSAALLEFASGLAKSSKTLNNLRCGATRIPLEPGISPTAQAPIRSSDSVETTGWDTLKVWHAITSEISQDHNQGGEQAS
jgi:hypothetical protein